MPDPLAVQRRILPLLERRLAVVATWVGHRRIAPLEPDVAADGAGADPGPPESAPAAVAFPPRPSDEGSAAFPGEVPARTSGPAGARESRAVAVDPPVPPAGAEGPSSGPPLGAGRPAAREAAVPAVGAAAGSASGPRSSSPGPVFPLVPLRRRAPAARSPLRAAGAGSGGSPPPWLPASDSGAAAQAVPGGADESAAPRSSPGSPALPEGAPWFREVAATPRPTPASRDAGVDPRPSASPTAPSPALPPPPGPGRHRGGEPQAAPGWDGPEFPPGPGRRPGSDPARPAAGDDLFAPSELEEQIGDLLVRLALEAGVDLS